MESFCVSSNTFPGFPNRIPGPPGTPDTFPGHIGSFPWLLLMVILIFLIFLGSKKRVQERFEVSWYSRRSELVKWQYNPNDHKWGIFGCIKDCYIRIQWWLLDSVTRFLGFPRQFLRILDGFLDHFWWKYWYFSKDWFTNLLGQWSSSLCLVNFPGSPSRFPGPPGPPWPPPGHVSLVYWFISWTSFDGNIDI